MAVRDRKTAFVLDLIPDVPETQIETTLTSVLL